MKIANIDIQKCIKDSVNNELIKKGFNIEESEFILCGNDKLQKIENEESDEEYYIWVSLQDSNTPSAKYDDALSAIADKVVEGETILGFDNLLEFCKWYVSEAEV